MHWSAHTRRLTHALRGILYDWNKRTGICMAKELLSYANKHMHAWLHSLTQTQTHTAYVHTVELFFSACLSCNENISCEVLASDHLNGGPHQQHSNNLFGRWREYIIKCISSHSKRRWCDLSNTANHEQLWFCMTFFELYSNTCKYLSCVAIPYYSYSTCANQVLSVRCILNEKAK